MGPLTTQNVSDSIRLKIIILLSILKCSVSNILLVFLLVLFSWMSLTRGGSFSAKGNEMRWNTSKLQLSPHPDPRNVSCHCTKMQGPGAGATRVHTSTAHMVPSRVLLQMPYNQGLHGGFSELLGPWAMSHGCCRQEVRLLRRLGVSPLPFVSSATPPLNVYYIGVMPTLLFETWILQKKYIQKVLLLHKLDPVQSLQPLEIKEYHFYGKGFQFIICLITLLCFLAFLSVYSQIWFFLCDFSHNFYLEKILLTSQEKICLDSPLVFYFFFFLLILTL